MGCLASLPCALLQIDDANKQITCFFIAIAEAIGARDLWADVSMLHLPQDLPTNPLDLGWLLSSAGEGDLAASVTPAGLAAGPLRSGILTSSYGNLLDADQLVS